MSRGFFQHALWVWLAFALLVVPARAAAEAEALTPTLSHRMGEGAPTSRPQYRVTHWTVENGLPQNSINAMVQTRDGYLWLATLKGLARFDGVRFKVFDHNNTPEMTHDSINDLAEDRKDGSLWIGTGDGLLNYRDHRFERYGAEQGIHDGVGNLCSAESGGVWLSCRWGQVGLAKAGRVEFREFGLSVPTNTVNQLGEAASDQLLAILGPNRHLYQIQATWGSAGGR